MPGTFLVSPRRGSKPAEPILKGDVKNRLMLNGLNKEGLFQCSNEGKRYQKGLPTNKNL